MPEATHTDTREVRDVISDIELRAAPSGSKSPGTIVGYAAVFDKYSCDLGMFREKLQRGCFTKALQKNDVRALFNHEPDMLLGRMSAGTLRLIEDETGLRMECDLPDTTAGRDVAENIRLRNLQGQSFTFSTNVDEWNYSSDPALRTVVEVNELLDVGPVAFPAYEETSVAMRSLRAHQDKPPAPPEPEGPPPHTLEHERDSSRLRLLEVS